MKSTTWSESRYLYFQQNFSVITNSGFRLPRSAAIWTICAKSQGGSLTSKLRRLFQKLFRVMLLVGIVFVWQYAREICKTPAAECLASACPNSDGAVSVWALLPVTVFVPLYSMQGGSFISLFWGCGVMSSYITPLIFLLRCSLTEMQGWPMSGKKVVGFLLSNVGSGVALLAGRALWYANYSLELLTE